MKLAGESISRILYAARIPSIPPFAESAQDGPPEKPFAAWRSFLWAFDHSKARCGLPEGSSLQSGEPLRRGKSFEPLRGSQDLHRAGPALPSYLALLHAGFARLPILLPGRWALTPPFHPYLCGAQTGPREVLPLAGRRGAFLTGGLFSVALSVAEAFLLPPPDVIRRVALTVPKRRSPDFPPARSLRDALRRTDQRSPDSPAGNYYRRHRQCAKAESGLPGAIHKHETSAGAHASLDNRSSRQIRSKPYCERCARKSRPEYCWVQLTGTVDVRLMRA